VRNIKKIGAFTIIELAVSMLISGILIAVLYYAYFLFTGQFRQFENKAETTGEFLLFQTALQKDIDDADNILDSSGVLTMQRINGSNRSWEADDSHIVRHSDNLSDTFNLLNEGWEIKTFDGSIALVKSVGLKLKIGKEGIEALFKKRYSAAQLLSAQNNQYEPKD
jgi:type II secretory pathway pseudopilin PulG